MAGRVLMRRGQMAECLVYGMRQSQSRYRSCWQRTVPADCRVWGALAHKSQGCATYTAMDAINVDAMMKRCLSASLSLRRELPGIVSFLLCATLNDPRTPCTVHAPNRRRHFLQI